MTKQFVLCCLLALTISTGAQGRSLFQDSAQAPSGGSDLLVPSNREVVEASEAAIVLANAILEQAGQVDEAGIQEVTLDGGHGAAEGTFGAAGAGQSSAVHAGVAVTGAALLAAGGALTNNPEVIQQARAAIATSEGLVEAVQDEEILEKTAAEFGNLAILAQLAHDGSLVHYWQNASSGPQDNDTFGEWLETSASIYEVVEEQLEAGASESLGVLAAQYAAYNMLGAIYNFQDNKTAVAQQNINTANVLLKAVRHAQTGTPCSAGFSAVDPPLNAAVEATTAAGISNSDADFTAAIEANNALLEAAQCSDLAPALAPAAAVSSAGRK